MRTTSMIRRRDRGVAVTTLAVLMATASLDAQETERVNVDSSGAEANGASDYPRCLTTSADGRIVAFTSAASNLVAGDGNGAADVFVRDRTGGITERVSVDSFGVEGDLESGRGGGLALSADGQLVAFSSDASNLVAGDTNGMTDVFVHDRATGITERVSVDSAGMQADATSFSLAMTPDGLLVAFQSVATNLVMGDTNGVGDIFVHDRVSGVTERVSLRSSGAEANDYSFAPAISADGRYVAFSSNATNLVPNDLNVAIDVFLHDRVTGSTKRMSVASGGAQGNKQSGYFRGPAITADGQLVAFESDATNLVMSDTNGATDIFVHDVVTGATERVSIDSAGFQGKDNSVAAAISADGRILAIQSFAANLIPSDTNGVSDIFLHDRASGLTERVSVDSSGGQANSGCSSPAISADGHVIAFLSGASNLVAGDGNGVTDDFLHELCSIDASWSNYGAGYPGTSGVPAFTARSNPVLGSSITLDLDNSLGSPTFGLLFIGFQQTSIPSSWGGDLLVVPAIILPISFAFGPNSYTGDLPDDLSLCGVAVDLQAIESDPGAAKGVSFTPGLELLLGQ
jgi:Tol biopolymer transport system component